MRFSYKKNETLIHSKQLGWFEKVLKFLGHPNSLYIFSERQYDWSFLERFYGKKWIEKTCDCVEDGLKYF